MITNNVSNKFNIINDNDIDSDICCGKSELEYAAEMCKLVELDDSDIQIASESWYYKPWLDYDDSYYDDEPGVKQKGLYIMVRNQEGDGNEGKKISHWTSIKVFNSQSKKVSLKHGAAEVSVLQSGTGKDRRYEGLGEQFKNLKPNERIFVENFVRDNFMYLVEYWMAPNEKDILDKIEQCMRNNVKGKDYMGVDKHGEPKFKVNYAVCLEDDSEDDAWSDNKKNRKGNKKSKNVKKTY